MSDISSWLQGLGLERYCEVFASNDIDVAVVPDLTEQDLERLGLSLGHRRKLLAAASKLRQTAAMPAGPVAPAAPAKEVERRQVTVVFTDLVGSTAIASQLDPEDLDQLLSRYRDACARVIESFDGHIAQYLGDGVLAYFGYPRAQEQATERAIRSALGIVMAVARLQRPDGQALQARVGVATGLVVGHASADGREQTVVGDTPNLAARLQALAAPGSVLVSPMTRQLSGDFFEYVSAGEHALKGFDKPVPVWKVVRERRVESRFAASRGRLAGPIVAREREQVFLLDSWQRAVQGNGHLVLLGGDAGMGKSRLIEALAERVRDTPHRLLRCQCSPYHRNSALYPLTQLLRHEAAIQPEHAIEENLSKLEALLTRVGRTSRRDLLLIAELLDLPTPDRVSPMEMTTAQRNMEILAILEDFVLATPDDVPVLLLLEDAHWSDPTTQILVERLLSRIGSCRVLALVSHRPEFRKPWGEHMNATAISCKPLGHDQSAAVARRAAGTWPIDEALVRQIVQRSDGVPLYVEELTKAVIDMQAAHTVVVPSTLQDSLMSRLDRLGEAEDIALVASVIGRHFSYPLLAAIAGVQEASLRAGLDRLIGAGLVFATEDLQQGGYSFNHSLVQEAAYQSLSRSRRQALHLGIAELLASQQNTAAASAPEIVAHHFDRAAQPERSCAYWMLAAETSGRRSAHAEAIANLNAALAQAEQITDAAARARCTIEAQLKLGATFNIQAGPLSHDMAAVLAQAYALAKEANSERQLFQATWGLYITKANSRQFDDARVLGEELLEISRKLGDDDLQMEGLHHRWGFWYFTGQTGKMLEVTREGIHRYDSQRHHSLSHVYAGHDPGVCAHCCTAIGLGLAGLAQDATASLDAALALAESVQHPFSLTFALGNGSVAMQLAGDIEACQNMAGREMQVAKKYDLPLQHGLGQFMFGLARTQQDDIAAGLAMMEANYDTALRHSFLGVYPYLCMVEALRRAGRGKEALALVTRTFDTLISPEVGIYVSELWRLRAELALADSAANAALAEGWLRTAVRIASEQGATVYRTRAESALAQLVN
ncbi:adenylate/guanylate cyclase domain-containing protein [Variovorax humicola]|uniref:Adenylate/guanylate cyclase domain-containing protein n=1 Tax=Variovorax humicola TaxID=1769758 RepID=A0ABU8W9D0_9BURK